VHIHGAAALRPLLLARALGEMVDFGEFLADYPWVGVILAAILGVLIGIAISIIRWCTQSHAPAQVRAGQAAELWTCDEVILRRCRRACGACARCCPCRCRGRSSNTAPSSKAAVVSVLASCILGCDIAALSWAVALQSGLADMSANLSGDMEKLVVDDCMRDYEGLQPDDMRYIEARRVCIAKLESVERVHFLPHIRLTVDERVCDPHYLCEGADESTCLDKGAPLTADFAPGRVTACYQVIQQSKSTRDYTEKASLLNHIEQRCTGKSSWDGYERKVQLDYCMWKHLQTGLCTNDMRTNCPEDKSCCPIAQNSIADGQNRLVRADQYVCQKSPTVGLYCHSVGYVDLDAEGNFTSSDRPLCREPTCASFAWCRDFADIAGICMSEPCEMYRRSTEIAAGVIVCLSLAIVLDIVDVIMLLRFPQRRKAKATLNMMGVALRMVTYLLFVAGGVREFMRLSVQHSCFNPPGIERVKSAEFSVNASGISVLLSMALTIWVWYFTAQWGSVLIGLPHAKWRDQSA